ncbi:MAG: S1 RNA-binding domain-containing protein [Parcubacteria group bacterium]|jgi:small subunit ribosomal protein S1
MNDILDNLAKEVDKISDTEIVESAKKEKKSVKDAKEEVKDETLMGKLIGKNPITYPTVGETIVGRVIEVSTSEIYMDLAPFGTGVVMGKEIKDGMAAGKLKIGDEVTAVVTETENEDGYIELSIREASYEKAWDDIESKRDTQEKIGTKILSANKGGLLVEVNGISGFLPVSQLSSKNYPRVEDGDKNKILNLLKKLIGKELEVKILDADRESQKLIVSEKAATSDKDREIISNMAVGDVVSGEVSGVVDFGAFVKFSAPGKNSEETTDGEKMEGLVHISELAWQLIEDPRTIVKVGDRVEAKIIGIDADKISLSMRALQKDPWSEVEKKYKVNDIVTGTVHKINPFGAFVYLDKDIHGLAHISEMSEAYPGKTLDELIKNGEKYQWQILSIEPKEHRMGLVLADKKKAKKAEKTERKEEKTEKKEKKAKKEEGEKPKKTKKSKKEEK